MKKFLIYTALFLVLAVAYDAMLGYALEKMSGHARSGQALKNLEVAETAAPDILILGSSRASHHYVPDNIERALGGSAYVAGQDGNGIVMMDPLLHIISARHKPSTVIYDITPAFDIHDDDPHRYLPYLRMLWHKNNFTDSLIGEIDPTEPYKMQSKLFRYNSSPLLLAKGIVSKTNDFDRGYVPLYGVLDTTLLPASNAKETVHQTSELKFKLFREMISYCRKNDIRLYFAVSPQYNASDEWDPTLTSLIEDLDITVLDFHNHPAFSTPDYFSDEAHLNHTGATVYTDSVMARITASEGKTRN